MKRIIYSNFLLMALCANLFAIGKNEYPLKKTTVMSTRYFDINRITTPVMNNGVFTRHPINGNSDFSLDGEYLIYISGLWMAVKVNGEVRASAADYSTDFVGGAIDDSGNPFGKEDSTFRVYKISRGDNAATNPDYAQWPINLGAPSEGLGIPQLFGDQTLWCSFTDAYLENREYNPCPPLGAEIHLTVWGLTDSLQDVLFLRWEFFNKSENLWQDAYAGCFIDADIGFSNNNLVGSDSSLSMVYTFEHTHYQKADSCCAVGYVVLESPIMESPGDTAITLLGPVIDFKNVETLSPLVYKHNPYEWALPSHGENYAKYWIYRRLAGQDTAGNAMINPSTGEKTNWGLSGDPVSETGWFDELPQDRFMMISAGPFDVLPGETKAMTIAIIAVRDTNYFATVPALKKKAAEIITFFENSMGTITDLNEISPVPKQISQYQLFQNYPNPFNNSTRINFYLPKSDWVNLSVYNMRGRKLKTIFNGFKAAGEHDFFWNGVDDLNQQVVSGLYFYRLNTSNSVLFRKMIYLK